jgi:hypothetical protein
MIWESSSNHCEHVISANDFTLKIPAKGKSFTLSADQISVYAMTPKSGSLLNAVDTTLFVCDRPELHGYEFYCVPIRNDVNINKVTYTYKITRIL